MSTVEARMAKGHFDQVKFPLYNNDQDNFGLASAIHTSVANGDSSVIQDAFHKLCPSTRVSNSDNQNTFANLPFLSNHEDSIWNRDLDQVVPAPGLELPIQPRSKIVLSPLNRTQSSPTSFDADFSSSGVPSYLSLFSSPGMNSETDNGLSDLLKNFTLHRSTTQLSHATSLGNLIYNQTAHSLNEISGPSDRSSNTFVDARPCLAMDSHQNYAMHKSCSNSQNDVNDRRAPFSSMSSNEDFTQNQYWNAPETMEDTPSDLTLFGIVPNSFDPQMLEPRFDGGASTSVSTDDFSSSRDFTDLAATSTTASIATSSVWGLPSCKSQQFCQAQKQTDVDDSSRSSFFPGAAANGERGAQFTLIANVPHDTVRQDLVLEFRKYGRVELAMVVCDEASRHPHKEWTSTAGYAFVRFSKREEAAAAIQAAAMGLITIRGTRVRADWARKDSYAKRGRVSPSQGAQLKECGTKNDGKANHTPPITQRNSLNKSISYSSSNESELRDNFIDEGLSRFTSCTTATAPQNGSVFGTELTLQRAQTIDHCTSNNDLLLQLSQALSMMIGQLGEEQSGAPPPMGASPSVADRSSLRSASDYERTNNWTSAQGLSRLASADARCGSQGNRIVSMNRENNRGRKDAVGSWIRERPIAPECLEPNRGNYYSCDDSHQMKQGLGVFSGGTEDQLCWADESTGISNGNYLNWAESNSALHYFNHGVQEECSQYRDLGEFDDYLSPCSKGLLVVALRDVAGCPPSKGGLNSHMAQTRESPEELLRKAVQSHAAAAAASHY